MEQHMVYSEERGTWNLFVDGEWYFEGTYEQCDEAMFNNAYYDGLIEEPDEPEDYPDDYYDYSEGN